MLLLKGSSSGETKAPSTLISSSEISCATAEAAAATSISLTSALVTDLLFKVSGKVTGIASPQFRALPIFARDHLAAVSRSATALYRRVVVIVGHRPIVRQLFTRGDVADRDKRDLTAHADVRSAGMIAEDH